MERGAEEELFSLSKRALGGESSYERPQDAKKDKRYNEGRPYTKKRNDNANEWKGGNLDMTGPPNRDDNGNTDGAGPSGDMHGWYSRYHPTKGKSWNGRIQNQRKNRPRGEWGNAPRQQSDNYHRRFLLTQEQKKPSFRESRRTE